MGTGILATLTQTLSASIPGGQWIAVVLLVIGWALLLGLSVAFAIRVAARPQVLADSLRNVPVLVAWGMVSMGILSVGSATATVVPAHWPGLTSAAWTADGVLWTIGTVLGIATALGFVARLIGRDIGAPSATWGLPIVPPMVSATTGAALIPHLGSRSAEVWLLVITVSCFFLALIPGIVVFATAYHHHWRIAPLPLAASTTAWIPLGVVGQSTAAAQSIALRSSSFLVPDAIPTVQQVANVYGFVMLVVGAPLIAWATVRTVRGFLGRMPFVPGWWSLTFPIGTVCLGSHLLAQGSGLQLFHWVAVGTCLVLLGTWTLCAVSSLVAVTRHRDSAA